MKFLNQFNVFDFLRFADGKEFQVSEPCTTWVERDTNKILGTIVTVAITVDRTNYGEGKTGNNRFEKLKFKVKKQVSVPVDAHVMPINAVCKVYGDFNNMLSVTCDDIRIVEQKAQK